MEHVTLYTIELGDTIQTIAKKFQTTPSMLIQLNGNVPLLIQPRRQIHVPIPQNSHFIREGETVQDLLIRFKLSPEELTLIHSP